MTKITYKRLKLFSLKRHATYFILAVLVLTFIGCNGDPQNNTSSKTQFHLSKIDTIVETSNSKLNNDTVALKETFNEEDIITNDYLTERLFPIRKNFKRINSTTNWSTINKKDLWESTEGGIATFYYLNGVLEKIVTKNFGETFQQLSEYYLLKGKLSFLFEKLYRYNRPMYYDSTTMKEGEDTEVFDFEKSKITEDRSYFENGKLINQLNNEDCGSPFADDYLLEEQKRIKTNFDKLLKLGAEKKKLCQSIVTNLAETSRIINSKTYNRSSTENIATRDIRENLIYKKPSRFT